jgi:hypothetical protein
MMKTSPIILAMLITAASAFTVHVEHSLDGSSFQEAGKIYVDEEGLVREVSSDYEMTLF